jgi:hypothetical protein
MQKQSGSATYLVLIQNGRVALAVATALQECLTAGGQDAQALWVNPGDVGQADT